LAAALDAGGNAATLVEGCVCIPCSAVVHQERVFKGAAAAE
jgi:hypothetical protein